VSYLLFALLLLRMPATRQPGMTVTETETRYRLIDSVRLLLRNPILLSTTLMFMLFNLGFGAVMVWLPILADQTFGGGAALFGTLLGALALGELVSSTLVGMLDLRLPLGRLICVAQVCSGIALGALAFQLSAPVALVSLTLLGFFSAPLTIWAQTLRMQIIPANLRGRSFALLRMLMQSAFPLGGMVGGFALPLLALPLVVGLSAGVIGLPGVAGARVRALWHSSDGAAASA
jgi:MFS family permease